MSDPDKQDIADATRPKEVGRATTAAPVNGIYDFVVGALRRKGQRVSLKPSVERLLGKQPTWEPTQREQALELFRKDACLAVPRQLLLASRTISGYTGLRAAIRDFARDVMLQHPIFTSDSMAKAIRNLEGAPDLAEVLRELRGVPFTAIASWPEWARVSRKSFRTLILNASSTLIVWYVETRGIRLREALDALGAEVWGPSVARVTSDDERLRALCDSKEERALGVAFGAMRDELRRTRQEAASSRNAYSDVQGLLATAKVDVDRLIKRESSLLAELDATREATAKELAQKDVLIAHGKQDFYDAQSRIAGIMRKEVANLEDVLVALKRSQPLVEVATDYVDRVIEQLRKVLDSLKRDD